MDQNTIKWQSLELAAKLTDTALSNGALLTKPEVAARFLEVLYNKIVELKLDACEVK